jgi:L-glutamine-phosphate cytidylyltransferase
MRAIILAAGGGKRLRDVTDNPKCMLEVGGESLINRQLRLLGNVHSAPLVVVGYKYQTIIDHIGHKDMVMNPVWKQSNTLLSLLFAIPGSPMDCLVINGDVVFSEDLLEKMLAADYNACAVQVLDSPTEEEVKVDGDRNRVTAIGKNVRSDIEAVGVYLFRRPMVKAIRNTAYKLESPITSYYEDALNLCLESNHPMCQIETVNAVEIDTPEDYERARDIYG